MIDELGAYLGIFKEIGNLESLSFELTLAKLQEMPLSSVFLLTIY